MSDIKKVFTSRWTDGYILEVDWNQLEVVILQVESQDPMLLNDISSGLDLHTGMTSVVYGKHYDDIAAAIKAGDSEWIHKRKKIKSARFALQYGASPSKIAKVADWSEGEARIFVDTYYDRYKGIKIWQGRIKKEVVESAQPVLGSDLWKGQYISPNGRRYVFTGEMGKWGKPSFTPTKLFNYPIQGLASDFVKMMRSKVIEALARDPTSFEWVKPINTIHDSVMFDVRDRVYVDVLDGVFISLEYGKAHHYLKEMLMNNRSVSVPLNYTTKFNHYWS